MTDTKTSLKKEAISSSGWGFLDKGIGFIVQFIIGIVLARLLLPADFGLIGLAMIIVGFGHIFVKLGLGPSLIQRKELTERHVRVVFTTSTIAGLILAIVVFMAAPIAARILGNNDVTAIIKALAIVFFISGLQIPSQALLKKRLDFKHLFYVNLAATLVYGSTTIILALAGLGVWSLVIGSICRRLLNLAGSYLFVRHSVKPLFAKKEFYDLAHFGSGMTLSRVFNYFALQGDYFMIGRILGARDLGLYTKAYALMQKPTTNFVSVITDVLFPAASKIQEDEERLKKVFLKSMRTIAFATIPLCMFLVIVAPQLILGIYGAKWRGAIVPIQILAGFGAFRAMYNASASFLYAKGLVYHVLYAQIVYGMAMLAGVWIGSSWFGLPGATLAVGIAIFLMWLMMMELNCRAIDLKRNRILHTLIPGLALALCVNIPIVLFDLLVTTNGIGNILVLLIFIMIALFFLVISILLLPQNVFHYLPANIMVLLEPYAPAKGEKIIFKLIKWLKKT